jgi:hypothetical protein
MKRIDVVASELFPDVWSSRRHARTIVTDGTADGRWTVEDRERLRGVFDRLNREQASEVLSSLYGEINAGRVHLELDGPPT